MADLQDVPVTESERRGLSALAPLAGVSPSGLTPGGGKTGRPIAQANIQLELPEFDPKNLHEWAEEFAEFLLLTGQSHVDVATKCSLLKRSCKKKFLQKKGQTDCENLFYLGRGTPEVRENISSL